MVVEKWIFKDIDEEGGALYSLLAGCFSSPLPLILMFLYRSKNNPSTTRE
jgi:hypothetical protein